MNDLIIHMDLGSDIDKFYRVVDNVGSEDMLTDSFRRFFIGRALSYVSARSSPHDIVNTVMGRIQRSIRSYYYKERDTSDIEKRIIDSWIFLAEGFKDQLYDYLYTDGRRNNKVVALNRFDREGLCDVIVTDLDEEFERGGFDE